MEPSLAIDVISYDATIEPDFGRKTVSGRVTIRLIDRTSAKHSVEFDSGDLIVDAVLEDGMRRPFGQVDHHLRVMVDGSRDARSAREIQIDYHGVPQRGIQFDQASYVFTIFSTSQWLVCIDDPSDKAILRLI